MAASKRTKTTSASLGKRKRTAGTSTSIDVAASPRTNKRRQTHTTVATSSSTVVDLTASPPRTPSSKKRRNTTDSPVVQKEERRLRVFRAKPPKSFLQKLERATSQRLFVLGRNRQGTDDEPEEAVDMVGTTGNVYKVVIAKQPSCTCPDAMKGNQCKHVVYVLHNVLKAPEHLQYQLAFISSELREIFEKAPLSPKDSAPKDNEAGNRKAIEGDCPICFMEFEPEKEEIVWCRAACGNNIHKTCFKQWAATQRGSGVSCVYCRSPWQDDLGNVDDVLKDGKINDEGYVNIAERMGLSGVRDHSTYHQPWVRRQYYPYRHYW